MASLDHPNIVKFVEFYDCETSYNIIMEYLKDGTLDEFIKKFPAELLPLNLIRRILQVTL
jgi:serine/threonine protein kinase